MPFLLSDPAMCHGILFFKCILIVFKSVVPTQTLTFLKFRLCGVYSYRQARSLLRFLEDKAQPELQY